MIKIVMVPGVRVIELAKTNLAKSDFSFNLTFTSRGDISSSPAFVMASLKT